MAIGKDGAPKEVQLMKAAPVLLEALKGFVSAIENEEILIYDNLDHDGFASTPNKLFTNAQQAIKKALD